MAEDANETPAEDAETGNLDTDVAGAEVEPEPVLESDGAEEIEASDGDDSDEELPPPSEAKLKADAVIAERRAKSTAVAGAAGKTERRVVTSRRVTPKAGAKAPAGAVTSKARDAKKTESVVSRTPPAQQQQVLSKGPSHWIVPALMFGLIILGGLLIMANYMGAFGDPANTRLVIGLALILGGIITATQYR